jgi:tetratricopeptide (TPR) repeat protein
VKRAWAFLAAAGALAFMQGCGGHSERTLPVRTALDEGQPRAAITEINKELGVTKDDELPKKVEGDDALLVLDRATIQQSLAQYEPSKKDFQAADKAIDMLDLARNAGDTIGEYVFSGSSGRYVAPPYEKLLINTLNMLNYLETGDLQGAKIEARRLTVMQKYIGDTLGEKDNAILGLAGFLAGFAFEKSDDVDEALRYYDEAAQFSSLFGLRGPVHKLLPRGTYTSPRLKALAEGGQAEEPSDDAGEILFVVGFGRVPHKIPNRIPIGLALTLVSSDIHPNDRTAANKLAAHGLVTWINFPSLAPGQGKWATPAVRLDEGYVQLQEAVDIDTQVRKEWKKIEGKVILSAITRLIARYAVGEGIQQASGKGSVAGFLGSLAAQATLTALDTPDTRSWETLPARIAVARVRVAPGQHRVHLDSRGVYRQEVVNVPKGGFKVISLMALR